MEDKDRFIELLVNEVKAVWAAEGVSYGLTETESLELDELIMQYEKSK